MKVLMVTPEPPWPLAHGAAIRNGLIAQALAAEHEVDLVTLAPRATPPGEIRGVRRVRRVPAAPRGSWRRRAPTLFGQTPELVRRFMSGALRAAVQQEVLDHDYDAVHIEGLQLAPLVHDVRATFAGVARRPAVVYDAHNVEWQLQRDLAGISRGLRRRYALRQSRLLADVEGWVVANADVAIASSHDDARALQALGEQPVAYLPHPVQVPARRPSARHQAPSPRVLLAANFAYRPNLLSARWLFGAVWPRVVRRRPDARLRVIGPQSDALRDIRPVATEIGGLVAATGDEYAAAWLALSPAEVGGGAPYKVLQAFAAGRPVVAHTAGLTGLPEGARAGLGLAGSAGEFAAEIVDFIDNDDRRRRAAAAGFAYVRQTHALTAVANELAHIYANLPARRASA